MKAWLAISASVMLVTIAQLLMKSGMSGLPLFSLDWLNFHFWISHFVDLATVIGGLTCYALSLGCWMLALSKLPLSIAYPCLSISYVLVTVMANILFDEVLSLSVMFGSVLIVLGVSLITYKPRRNTSW
ncbi:4-amino-4-deoxy-L-arabinose-phospho-UDP flippase [Marinomonas sp. CT5]|uniref:4-amino-4-deoxy-L-arabinose-phosphoundecaprenol flippase subunit ArnF n=1 Tax=Marinomonas sp. CT5 TaxID=2066133 RepID=UPI001BAEABFE|nr:4-amino-4-deoxy-L-arabinose-phosphoundecaprenol flippase subunit ArnF [Marinomonas sp. CT5]QUX97889.1 4-amino-4-deoxy-L-arabinose-phospho-UDP flippase [Marinomonas sp. CT5]